MRVLMWFTVGFAAASAAAAYVLEPGWLWLLCLACLAFCGACFALRRWKLAVVILAGCALGFGWYAGFDTLRLQDARAADGTTRELTVEISDFGYNNGYGEVAEGYTQLDGKRYRVRIYTGNDQKLIPGRTVAGEFRLRYTANGGREDPTHHRGEGIFLLAYATSDLEYRARENMRLRYIPAYLRQNVLDTLQAAFPADVSAFARALLLGDCTDLDYETDTAFKLSGIRHVIAVSGLHVSILFSLIYLVMGKQRVLNILLGLPLLLLFAAMAGFTPSINRACLMQVILLLAALVPREYDGPTALSFAVLVMLLMNPQSITSVGFQLSVASVAGILLFYGPLSEWMQERMGKRKGRWGRILTGITASAAVSLSATVFTAPLSALYFGTVSLVAVITNLLTLWIVNFLFCGIILTCLLSILHPPAGAAAAWLLAWPIRFVIGTAKLLCSLPISTVYTQSIYILLWVGVCYVLLGVFLLNKRKHPAVLAACMAVTLLASVAASHLEPQMDNWRLTVLDVGHGQCILLQSGGRTYMVDCGGTQDETAADLAAATLLSQGITQLDGLILTHYDRDHVGGAACLLTRIGAEEIYLPWLEDVKNDVPELANLPGEHVTENIQLLLGTAKLTIFAPTYGKTDNETSLCVLFQAGNCDILITGDRNAHGEMELLLAQKLPDLEILIAGHHGANSSTSEFLLRATHPETVIISVDEGNRYGHPAQALLERLTEHGCVILRTDLDGTIIIKG